MRDPHKADSELQHPRIRLLALDVTDTESIAQAITDTLACYQKIDVLLNNAGYALFGPMEASDRGQIQQQFATNLFGLIEVTQQVVPVMRAAGEGPDTQRLFHRWPFSSSVRFFLRCYEICGGRLEQIYTL